MIEFKLPSLGSDMTEGKLLEWKVKPGEGVKRGDVVAVVDTTKAAVEVEIWQEGVVHELIVQPGETVPVGTVMALLLAPGESAAPQARKKVSPAARRRAAQLGVDLAGVRGSGPEGAVTLEDVERARQPAPAAGASAAAPSARRRISPAARKRADELGVNLDALEGTGPGGAVTLEDVEKVARLPSAAEKVPDKIPDRNLEMRRAIAAAMSRSKREIPHYYLSETISLQRAAEWLEAENARRPLPERLLMAVLYLKATALACKSFPDMNGHYRDGGFAPAAAVHAGVAISLRQGGLIAPAIHDMDKLTLTEAMKKLADLVK